MTPQENEELKLEQMIASNPSLIKKLAGLLGSLKKGKRERVSQKKSDSSRETIKIALAARWKGKTKAEPDQSSSLDHPSEPKKPL